MGRRQKATGTHLVLRERQNKAVQMRRDGATFDEIGAALGITRQAAHQLVHRALAEFDTSTTEAVEHLRREEASKLAAVHEVLWPGVMAGDLAVTDRWLKLSARASQLLGLDRSITQPAEAHLHLHTEVSPSQGPADPVVIAGMRRWAEIARGEAPAGDVIDGEAVDGEP